MGLLVETAGYIMKRREFLSGLGSAGCALAGYPGRALAGHQWVNRQCTTPPGQQPKIVIIGAGLSGLASAWELGKNGFDVVVLEATTRVGGRVLTQRNGFLDGQYTEQGATLIPDTHGLTLSYVLAFELKLDPIPQSLSTLYYFGQKRYLENEENHANYPKSWRLNRDEDEHGLDWISGRLLPPFLCGHR